MNKILIISQHYWPENFRIIDIAESIASLGKDVTVLCGLPNYPKGYIFKEYKNGKNRMQIHNGVKIIRAKEIGRRKGIIFRFLNYWSFPHYACKLIKKIDKDFDVIYAHMSSPIMMIKPAIEYAKKYGKKIVMYGLDLWPESLLAGGISNSSLIYKRYKKISSNLYSNCDKILVSTKEHIEYIKKLPKCSELLIDYLPQYADTIFESTEIGRIDNGIIDLMFAGNIGKAQSIETIIKAANKLKNYSKFIFHIVGGGSELENTKKLVQDLELSNVVFYNEKPLIEMPNLYKLADVMIVSLEDKAYAKMTIPGKVQTYMAAGKPIIGVISGSGYNFILNNKIGFACEAEDYEGLAKIILDLNEKDLIKIGKHAKEVYFEKYSKQKFIKNLVENLEEFA